MLQLRRAGTGDGAAMQTVHAAAVRAGCRGWYEPDEVEAWAAALEPWRRGVDVSRRDVLLAADGGRVIAFGALDGDEVSAVYVAPDAWRRGVGQRLLGALESVARLRGVTVARLDASLNAVEFYAAAGWRRARESTRTFPDGRRVRCIAMTRRLPPAVLAIRDETPDDVAAVHEVERLAFGRADEADLVDRLRADGALAVSLVAALDRRVVGHVAFSPVAIGAAPVRALGLAPVAVRPELQCCAIGARLVEEGLARARERGAVAAVVLGHPGYYPRFGFLPASRFGVRYRDAPDDAFMAAELVPGALAGVAGTVRYHAAFDAV